MRTLNHLTGNSRNDRQIGGRLRQHQMSMNGKRNHFALEDFTAFAKVAGMKRGRDKTVLQEIQGAVSMWDGIATDIGIPKNQRDRIAQSFHLNIPLN